MTAIDWSSVLVIGAFISVSILMGAFLLIGACMIIGKEIARRNDEHAEKVIASTPDEVFIDAIRLYEGQ